MTPFQNSFDLSENLSFLKSDLIRAIVLYMLKVWDLIAFGKAITSGNKDIFKVGYPDMERRSQEKRSYLLALELLSSLSCTFQSSTKYIKMSLELDSDPFLE